MSGSGLLLILYGKSERDKAHDFIDKALPLSHITFRGPKRTIPQNDKLHAMIGEVATQLVYNGMRLSVDDWKIVFLSSLKQEMRVVPNLDNTGFVNLGRKTSRLTKEECSLLIEIVQKYGDEHGVVFKGDSDASDPAPF
jgi:hypothetical protein